jgi:hypothetical protein
VTVVSAVALFSLIKTAQVQKFAVLCSLVPPIEKLAELGQPRKTSNALKRAIFIDYRLRSG